MRQLASKVVDKLVRERIAVLKADKEFRVLKRLVPSKLKGRELGKDITLISTGPQIGEKRNDNGQSVYLSEREWKRYEKFRFLCDKLARKYGLHWVIVEDLATGVRQPTVPPRLSRGIRTYLDPVTFYPENFDPNIKYAPRVTFVPPLETIEIMRRLQGLDQQTKKEVKAYLRSVLADKPGCRILEFKKAESSGKDSRQEVEIDVCMEIPIGYTAKEVAEAYHKVDSMRREILACFGVPIPKRRRESKILKEVARLRLLAKNVNVYDIIDDIYGEDLSNDQIRRRAIISRRYKGRKLLKERYPHQ
jgi:hypothetical protein